MHRWIIGLCPLELLPGGAHEAECALAWLIEGMRAPHDLYFVSATRRGPPAISATLAYRSLLPEELRATATAYAHHRRDEDRAAQSDEGVFFVRLDEQQVALLEFGAVDVRELDDEIPLEALEAVAGQTKGGAPPR